MNTTTITSPLKGSIDEDAYTASLEPLDTDKAAVTLPPELLMKLGWLPDHIIEVSETENCFDWGEVPSLILRNITLERTSK
ncbi:MAG: hypothetical protein H8E12_15385 [Rhodobacteraceae bacterium]|nr:hypothetical protein [Paracoccaceae bacterium]